MCQSKSRAPQMWDVKFPVCIVPHAWMNDAKETGLRFNARRS